MIFSLKLAFEIIFYSSQFLSFNKLDFWESRTSYNIVAFFFFFSSRFLGFSNKLSCGYYHITQNLQENIKHIHVIYVHSRTPRKISHGINISMWTVVGCLWLTTPKKKNKVVFMIHHMEQKMCSILYLHFLFSDRSIK